jgi:hypothetical protein
VEAQLYDPKGKAIFKKPLRSTVLAGDPLNWSRLQAERAHIHWVVRSSPSDTFRTVWPNSFNDISLLSAVRAIPSARVP